MKHSSRTKALKWLLKHTKKKGDHQLHQLLSHRESEGMLRIFGAFSEQSNAYSDRENEAIPTESSKTPRK